MSTILVIGFTLVVLNNLIGIVANGSMVLIIWVDWRRSNKLSSTDLILVCLGLSRFLWQVLEILYVTMTSYFKSIYIKNNFALVFCIVWSFWSMVNLCFPAFLSVLYLVKIAIFSHPLFLHVKRGFPGLLPWLLLGSVIFSAVQTAVVFSCGSSGLSVGNSSKALLNSSRDSEIQMHRSCEIFATLAKVSHSIPVLMFLSSSILLISSLWKHIKWVRHNRTGVRDLSTEVHLTAIKALASFAVLYLICFVAATTESVLAKRGSEEDWSSILIQNLIVAYPTGHAIILILINPKLKQAWLRMIQHFGCPRRDAPF